MPFLYTISDQNIGLFYLIWMTVWGLTEFPSFVDDRHLTCTVSVLLICVPTVYSVFDVNILNISIISNLYSCEISTCEFQLVKVVWIQFHGSFEKAYLTWNNCNNVVVEQFWDQTKVSKCKKFNPSSFLIEANSEILP